RVPNGIAVVDGDRIRDAEARNGAPDVADIALEGELRVMHADYDQAVVLVLFGPRLDVRQRAQTVDARVCPDIEQHDLAAQRLRVERLRVEPLHRALERRNPAFNRQRRRAHGRSRGRLGRQYDRAGVGGGGRGPGTCG